MGRRWRTVVFGMTDFVPTTDKGQVKRTRVLLRVDNAAKPMKVEIVP